jgi:hypothetical protein
MADQKMSGKDFLTSIVLIVFSTTVIVMSITMPRLERRGIDPLSAPGVVPGLIGAVLLCLALILFFRSIKKGGYHIFRGEGGVTKSQHQGAATRVSLTLIVCLIYAVGLLGWLNYSIATALFIFTFICLFEIGPGQAVVVRRKIIVFALIQAVLASALVTLVFQYLFLIDLP